MSDIKNSSSQIRLPLILALAIATGILIGASVVEPKQGKQQTGSSISKFKEVIQNIDRNYVDEVNVPDLVDDAIIDMLEDLDPHTSYMSAEDFRLYSNQLKGHYDGIGVQYDIIRDTIVVIKPAPEGPSDEVGIRIGDRIVKVNEEPVAGVGIDTQGVRSRLLGEPGSKVKVTVLRPGEADSINFTLTRGSIYQPTVETSYMLDDETGYIKLTRFGSNSYTEFKNALETLLDEGMKRLVFDLQGNGGGYMSAAQKITDELLSGDRLIVSQKGKSARSNDSYYANHDGVFEDKPIIILIDEYTASASEIVSGALQDHDKALIVGRRSYGKGLVQVSVELSDGSELRLTTARYYTPSGRSIQKPYVKGEGKEYMHDIVDRYNQGEFFSKDSIQLADSLKFSTASGRTVYGGGGIMPDYFVPYDTTLNSNYYSGLIRSNAIRLASLNYYLDNESDLRKMSEDQFINSFEVDGSILNTIVSLATEFNVAYVEDEYNRSLPLIKTYFKAELGRSLFTDETFIRIMNEVNNGTLKKAPALFPEADRLLSLQPKS